MPDDQKKLYKVTYQYRQWIRKPDPSGFGKNTVVSDDYSWIHEQCLRLKSQGHRVLAVEKFDGVKYCKI